MLASLLRVDLAAGRFRTQGVVREYAAERLGADARVAAEARHGAYFAQLGTRASIDAALASAARWRAVAADLDDVVAACRRAIARGAGDVAVATLRAADLVFARRGPAAVRAALAQAVAAMPSLSPVERTSAAVMAGTALDEVGESAGAEAALAVALGLARDLRDPRAEGNALLAMGRLFRGRGRPDEARAAFEAAAAVQQGSGDDRNLAFTLANLGSLDRDQGHLQRARERQEHALALFRRVGSRRHEAMVLGNLANVEVEQGHVDEARRKLEQALAVHVELGDRHSQGVVLGNLGTLQHEHGRLVDAHASLERALVVHREVGNRRLEAAVLTSLGGLLTDLGRPDEAFASFRRSLGIQGELGAIEPGTRTELARLCRALGRVDEARQLVGQALAEGRRLASPRIEAYALCELAALQCDAGDLDAAERSCLSAIALHGRIGNRLREAEARAQLGRVLEWAGRADEAKTELERANDSLRALGVALSEAVVAVAFARVTGRLDGPAAALRRLGRAERTLRAAPAPAALAEARVCRADLLDRAGDPDGADAALAEAAAAAPWCAPVAAEILRVRGRTARRAHDRGELERAEGRYAAAVEAARTAGDARLHALLAGHALVRIERGRDASTLLAELDLQRVPAPARALARAAAVLGGRRTEGSADADGIVFASDLDRALAATAGIEALLDDDDRAGAVRATEQVLAALAEWPATCEARRVTARILSRRVDALRRRAHAWRVATDGKGFAAPLGSWVDLGNRPTLARIVCALLDGRTWTLGALGEAVWPAERMVGHSLRNRVQVAVSTLRKVGLTLVQRTEGGGYRLDPSATIEPTWKACLQGPTEPRASRRDEP